MLNFKKRQTLKQPFEACLKQKKVLKTLLSKGAPLKCLTLNYLKSQKYVNCM